MLFKFYHSIHSQIVNGRIALSCTIFKFYHSKLYMTLLNLNFVLTDGKLPIPSKYVVSLFLL